MTREEEIKLRALDSTNDFSKYLGFIEGAKWADENRPVDWQQVRIQAAIAAMQGILANQSSVVVRDEVVIRESVSLADALVKELKGE